MEMARAAPRPPGRRVQCEDRGGSTPGPQCPPGSDISFEVPHEELVAQTGSLHLGGANSLLVCITDLATQGGVCHRLWDELSLEPSLSQSHVADPSVTQRGSPRRGGAADEDSKDGEDEAKRYQEFQNRQVQSLLELREAQADTEAQRRLEHLKQVRGPRWPGKASWIDLSSAQRHPSGPPCPQAQQRLREVVLDANTTQFKRLKETNER
ncbi:hypothetical protein P7K49_021594 [Saguinus oedipus]|uniref:Phospholipase C-beta C-terminal domain-containing protein n=1 Tax=Saguinus oedipus TaxID=9490 RepID=A0ABQ9UT49_SAGOE|nr:hypothetical protein P7K49_021594 [Saguinus oedipus]